MRNPVPQTTLVLGHHSLDTPDNVAGVVPDLSQASVRHTLYIVAAVDTSAAEGTAAAAAADKADFDSLDCPEHNCNHTQA